MLGLEKGPRAAIVTIGAEFFDPMTGELGAESETHIDLLDSVRLRDIALGPELW